MNKPRDPKRMQQNFPAVAERDERLLSVFLDGELPDDAAAELRARLQNEPILEHHLEGLTQLRRGVTEFFRQSELGSAEAIGARDLMWARIEQQLRPQLGASGESRVGWWERVVDALRARPMVVSVSVALGLFLFATPRSGSVVAHRSASVDGRASSGRTAASIGASVGGQGSSEASEELKPPAEPMVLSEQLSIADQQDESPTTVALKHPQQDLLARVGIDDIEPVLNIDSDVPPDLVGRLMPSSTVASTEQFDGGYRAGGVDIAWIRSDRQVRLVSSKRFAAANPDSAAPVVWVSRTNSHR